MGGEETTVNGTTVRDMTGIEFEDATEIRYRAKRGARFRIKVDGRPLECRVTHGAIRDHCQAPESKDACLDAARRNFEKFKRMVARKIYLGDVEADGGVVIKRRDWNRFDRLAGASRSNFEIQNS